MKVLGIICEYNPLHNGHLYHISQSIQCLKPDYTVAIMSGNVVQRGELAIMDKWTRTNASLHANVDLVIELPSIFACQSAEYFAFGAISLLTSLGVVTDLSFGSESNNLPVLQSIANTLGDEPILFQTLLRKQLDLGHSFAIARAKALTNYLENNHISQLLNSSNDILGIEYLKAIKRLQSKITVHTIKRQGPGYHSQNLSDRFVSASKIRSAITSHSLSTMVNFMPSYSYNALQTAIVQGATPNYDLYSKLALFQLRNSSAKTLSLIPGISEGLEHRFLREAHRTTSLETFLEAVKTKRYAYTRMNRIVLSTLLNITSSQLSFYASNGVPYARILGFKQRALPLLTQLKQTSSIPIITKAAHYQSHANKSISSLINLDAASTDLFYLCCTNPDLGVTGKEFSTPVIIQ